MSFSKQHLTSCSWFGGYRVKHGMTMERFLTLSSSCFFELIEKSIVQSSDAQNIEISLIVAMPFLKRHLTSCSWCGGYRVKHGTTMERFVSTLFVMSFRACEKSIVQRVEISPIIEKT